MTDRVQKALRDLGIEAPPIATLERDGAFFALLPELLLYQDGQGTRRVTLRDLTRIHSDQQGALRVETPAGTALTASLLGFDPGQVQAFFAQVRDATAQAKHLPAAPLPTPGGLKTFGSVPKPAPAATSVPSASPTPHVKEVRSGPPAQTAPSSASPPRETVREVRAAGTESPPPATLVATPATTPPAVPATVAEPAERVAAAEAGSVLAALAARANAVQSLVSRLQLLGVVLGLAAVGLAVFQFLDGALLSGMWTLMAGGVSCIALLAFADVTRLIVSLARAVAEREPQPARPDAGKSDG
ncbi:hypothetical protein [Deinococcus sp. YIM 77859]|uniref:hypothetical protein n=1 Tax=Deinococcus sp. YIM 77859 TaxID=1540221 RepID=UPI000556F232|nr:hypothetical protein [Deinococcus sp. YIM 77859]